ncbi:MerR family transcriptional regulator [Gorillibacterium timonense]|uniref:MerR family transcriptional regulator n=1 Tax=Gorillibacterium timonense TaxID=1689269 RepID=UPI00071CAEEF|nr:MerR family transcriptional regulator [Gorillibacterium timonense]
MSLLIHELCKECGLTKKAVNYYVEQGLLEPVKGENGYRHFTPEDAAWLKEVTLLRKLGAGIPAIKQVREAVDRHGALAAYQRQLREELEQMIAKEEVLAYWILHPNETEAALCFAARKLDGAMSLKDKLELAFPGNYGVYLSLHFGPFLNEPIRTKEQEQAYSAILVFLDEVEADGLPEELAQDMEDAFAGFDGDKLAQMNEGMKKNLDQIDRFLQENRDFLQEYIRYRQSEEYLTSPVYQLQQRMEAFQQASGYFERFIPNLKILSPSYRAYTEHLAAANERLLTAYPEAGQLSRRNPATDQAQ